MKRFKQFVKEAGSQCALCKCPATGKKFGFSVCDYHQTHGEDDPPCPKCGWPGSAPVTEAGGGGSAGGSSGGGMSSGGDPGEGEGVAANNAGEGNIAGIGVNKAGKPANWGEPGVDLEKHRREMKKEAGNEYDYTNDIMTDEYDVREELVRENLIEAVETFAGAPVFTVDMDRVMKSRFGKNRYHRYDRYVGNDSVGEAIRQYGRKNPGDIILKDEKTAVMSYLRRATPVGE